MIHTLYYSQNCMLKMLSIKLFINMKSHPLRVRGLKQRNDNKTAKPLGVASFTDTTYIDFQGQRYILWFHPTHLCKILIYR